MGRKETSPLVMAGLALVPLGYGVLVVCHLVTSTAYEAASVPGLFFAAPLMGLMVTFGYITRLGIEPSQGRMRGAAAAAIGLGYMWFAVAGLLGFTFIPFRIVVVAGLVEMARLFLAEVEERIWPAVLLVSILTVMIWVLFAVPNVVGLVLGVIGVVIFCALPGWILFHPGAKMTTKRRTLLALFLYFLALMMVIWGWLRFESRDDGTLTMVPSRNVPLAEGPGGRDYYRG